MKKRSKASVNYRKATVAGERCGTCCMFEPPDDCTDVTGEIRPQDVCNIWYVRAPTIFFVRHGSTEHNKGGPGRDRVRGHADIPMTAQGVFEVNRTADILAGTPISVIHASDLKRSRRAAEIIAGKQSEKPKIIVTEKLRTWNLGPDMEGSVTTPAMIDRVKSLVRNANKSPSGGESFNEFSDRIIGYIVPIFAKTAKSGGEIAIVSHGRVAQIVDLWVNAKCDKACMFRDFGHKLTQEPDVVPPGGAMKYTHIMGRWGGEVVSGTARKAA